MIQIWRKIGFFNAFHCAEDNFGESEEEQDSCPGNKKMRLSDAEIEEYIMSRKDLLQGIVDKGESRDKQSNEAEQI